MQTLSQKMMYKSLVLLTVLAVQQTVASSTYESELLLCISVWLRDAMWCNVMYIGGYGENECVCQDVAIELATVKADMQGQVDTLQSQLNYWQNVTINTLKDLHSSKGYVHKSCIEAF